MNRETDIKAPAHARVGMFMLAALAISAIVNAVVFTWRTAIEIPGSDAWYFMDTFIRSAVNGQLQLADFFVQRGPSDHAQPLQKFVLWSHLRLAHLNFKVEAVIGVAAGILAYGFLAWLLFKYSSPGRERVRAMAGACLVFVVGLSLNSTNLFTWSLVTLGWVLLVVCFLYWALLGRDGAITPVAWLGLVGTFLMSLLLDELAYPTFIAAVLAVVLRDGWTRPAKGILLGLAGGVGLFAGRMLLLKLSPGQSAAEYSEGSGSQLLSTLMQPDAWKLIVVPLAESLIHQSNVENVAPRLVGTVSWGLAAVLGLAHVIFWIRVFAGKTRPAPVLFVVSVAMMLFFYATIAGIALSRIPTFGMDYLHQPRYVMMYQLNIIALVLMFFGPAGERDHQSDFAYAGLLRAVAFIFLVAIQLPLSKLAWNSAPYVRNYAAQAERALLELGANPRTLPAEGCPPILTVCGMPTSKRMELMGLLKKHHLSLYADRATASVAGGDALMEKPAACSVDIDDWGPREVKQGVPFNQQADGRSAFWVKLMPDAGNFTMRLKGKSVSFDRGGDTISFFADEAIQEAIAHDPSLEFEIFCGNTAGGRFTVRIAK